MSRIHRPCILGTTTLLAVLLVGALAAGCGGNDSQHSEAADSPSPSGTTSAGSTPALDSIGRTRP